MLGAVALAAAGCGGDDDDYKNEERPPAPIVVSASINEERVSVSPRSFGAGPITLIVTNQTQSAQELTLETDEIGGDAPGVEQETGPISPGDTASLKADLRQGTYRVAVNGRGIGEAAIEVGEPRESAQDQLLQP
ncbi:MAG: hypothetical protein M3389_09635 [Actinomycetota bacterium]|nr:hypothetical protein [Actinomycetota bacterium]